MGEGSPKGAAHRIVILEDRCKGCRFCLALCPKDVLEDSSAFNTKGYHPPRVADIKACNGCKACQFICPDFAIYHMKLEADVD